jgi:IS5 family transposase
MVGLHILKHRYNCSDERAVEELQENAYWQCFCGFETFQTGVLLDATSLVKFRNRLGAQGMKQIEAVLLRTWGQMGLVRTKKIAADTTAQPKNISYPTDVDLLHRIREKIVQRIKRVREEVTLQKSFRPFSRVSKKMVLGIKKFYRRDPQKRAKATQTLRKIVTRVVHQGEPRCPYPLCAEAKGFGASPSSIDLAGHEDCRANRRGSSGPKAQAKTVLFA